MHSIHDQIIKKTGQPSDTRLSTLELSKFLAETCGETWPLLEQEEIYNCLEEAGISFSEEPYDLVINRINALKTVLLSHSFFDDHRVFEKVVLALNDKIVEPHIDQELDIADIAFAIEEIESVIGVEKNFSSDIRALVAIVAFDDGLVLLPGNIDFAQEELDILSKRVIGDLETFKNKVKALYEKKIEELDDENPYDIQAIKLKRISLCCNVRSGIKLG